MKQPWLYQKPASAHEQPKDSGSGALTEGNDIGAGAGFARPLWQSPGLVPVMLVQSLFEAQSLGVLTPTCAA